MLCAAEPRKTSLVELLRILENDSVMGAETLGAESHFVDLGAGFGKVVFGAALMTNTPRATGIELSELFVPRDQSFQRAPTALHRAVQ